LTPVRVGALASKELHKAARRYEKERRGLGTQFIGEVWRVLDRVSINPHAFAADHVPGVFKAKLSQFPYTIYFAHGPNVVPVVAVAHHSRLPDYWHDRL
jgi:hypothetical protein